MNRILFALSLLVTLVVFARTVRKYVYRFRLTRPYHPSHWGRRISVMLQVAVGQSRIFRRPAVGLIHALTFWGFCVITVGSLEMVVDGLSGRERSFALPGPVYNGITASGDLFALIVLIAILIFLVRRILLNISRFKGVEMQPKSHADALIALMMIFLLMVSLLGMNTTYLLSHPDPVKGYYPVSSLIASRLASATGPTGMAFLHPVFWWTHILLIFVFANILPYSKHFHVFLSIPNVLLSRLDPPGKMENMAPVMNEVRSMLYPGEAVASAASPGRFGLLDPDDGSWKMYLDSLTCTECGRCTDVCPANKTGKLLSPRKIMIDYRARMKELANDRMQNGHDHADGRSYLGDYITPEEIWACTTCNACVRECPVEINQPALILEMRRYLVMERAAAPAPLNQMFGNVENNGAPWQYGAHERLKWTEDLAFEVPLVSNLHAEGKKPEYLLWIGCAGAFDDRYRKVARSLVKILHHLGVDYAVLGTEETCTGDPARRAGNEMLFHMQALTLIDTFRRYEIPKIITLCPHCYNTFRNEYPDLGYQADIQHYTRFLSNHPEIRRMRGVTGPFRSDTMVFHDPCYLGRSNGEYKAPRSLLSLVEAGHAEMDRHGSKSFCCGAGGAQYFKEAEPGRTEVFLERTREAVDAGASVVATACPFCMTMLSDGVKYLNLEEKVRTLDVAEILAMEMGL